MSQKLRVLFLPKWYPNKFDILDGNFVENHAKAVAKYCELGVLFVHSDSALQKSYETVSSTANGFLEIRVYFKKPRNPIRFINRIITFFRYFRAQLKGYSTYRKEHKKPDITHIHVLGRTAPLAFCLKLKSKIPFLITEHWSGYHKRSGAYKGFLKKWITKLTAKNAAYLTTVSEDLKHAMQSHHIHGNYFTVPNVIDTHLFKPKAKTASKAVRFIHISNLSAVPKNLNQIILNLIDLADKDYTFEFILAGYGEDEKAMLDLINQSSLRDLTTFKGKLSQDEVAHELSQADAMLLFSLYENQPVVMIESFACGVPVIVPDVGGISEIMNADLGILVEAENNASFKEALISFLDKKVNYNSQEIRKYAVERFSEEAVGRQFLNLYQNLELNG